MQQRTSRFGRGCKDNVLTLISLSGLFIDGRWAETNIFNLHSPLKTFKRVAVDLVSLFGRKNIF